MRDSIAFTVCYAHGLRRREPTMLEVHDFGPTPHVAGYGRFGAVQVRRAKATTGSGPRRRTVLTVPEFDGVVDLLQFWTGPGGRARSPAAEAELHSGRQCWSCVLAAIVDGLLTNPHHRQVHLARFNGWRDTAIPELPTGEHHEVLRRFVRRHLARQMTTVAGGTAHGSFRTAAQATPVAIDVLAWPTIRGATLGQLAQADPDAWQARGSTVRELADRLPRWAVTADLVDPSLRVRHHRRGTASRLSHTEQTRVLARIKDQCDLTARDRLVAILVLVLAHQVEDLVRLTWNQATVDDDRVIITAGAHPADLPPPLDEPLRRLVTGHDRTAAHPTARGSSGVTPLAVTSTQVVCGKG